MAKAIDYDWIGQDLAPSKERKLKDAPVGHAEAVLSAYELLEEARREQVIDLLRGAMSAKAEIISALADLGSKPTSVNAMRNLITLAQFMGEIDPALLSRTSTSLRATIRQRPQSPPSLWQLFRRANHPEVRRGLSFLMEITAAVGRATESGA